MQTSSVQKIAVIGNAAGGKTRLSKKLAEIYQLPVTHIDSIQFMAGMKIRPLDETRKILTEITASSHWIIDGYGPLDLLEKRLKQADQIVLIDFPIQKHYWWFIKRQIKNIWSPRAELPQDCNELSLQHTLKIFKSMKKAHEQMRPELLRILSRDHYKNKLTLIQNQHQWNHVCNNGL